MANINFKRIMRKVWNVIKKIALVIVVVLLGTLAFVLFINPISFFIWSLIVPGFASRLLHDSEMGFVGEIIDAMDGWVPKLLPWYAKRRFIEADLLRNFSGKVQFKYFRKENHTADCLKQMDEEGVQYTWNHGSYEERGMIAEVPLKLTDEQFKWLLKNGFNDAARTYLGTYTPTNGNYKALLKAIVEGNEKAVDTFLVAVVRYGISSSRLTSVLDSAEYTDALKTSLKDAVWRFGQKSLVQRYQDTCYRCEFSDFCQQNKTICEEAQSRMALWQYEVYHKTGHKLSPAVVVSILKGGAPAWARQIFSFEPNFGIESESTQAIVNANPELLRILIAVRQSKQVR